MRNGCIAEVASVGIIDEVAEELEELLAMDRIMFSFLALIPSQSFNLIKAALNSTAVGLAIYTQ